MRNTPSGEVSSEHWLNLLYQSHWPDCPTRGRTWELVMECSVLSQPHPQMYYWHQYTNQHLYVTVFIQTVPDSSHTL